MQLEDVLSATFRPKILMRAAKIGLKTYSRDKELKRLFGTRPIPQPRQAIEYLVFRETELENVRKIGDAAYNMNAHIQVMTALLQELHLLPKEEIKHP